MVGKEELLDELERVAQQVDGTPKVKHMKEMGSYSHNAYYRHFDSWNAALREANYSVNQNMKAAKGNVDDLLDAIIELSDGDKAPPQSKMTNNGRYSLAAYYRYFESWTEAVKKAGLEPRREMGKRIEKVCDICGEDFDVKPSNSNQRFCGQECFGKHRTGKYCGENHPNYRERVEVECDICGTEVKRPPWRVERFHMVFCGKDCRAEWTSDRFSGEGNYRWSGGANIEIDYYGPNWAQKRIEVIIEQQAKCRVCETQENNLDSQLEVHHIKPVRHFEKDGEIEWNKANKVANLTALCNSCHKTWEGFSHTTKHIIIAKSFGTVMCRFTYGKTYHSFGSILFNPLVIQSNAHQHRRSRNNRTGYRSWWRRCVR